MRVFLSILLVLLPLAQVQAEAMLRDMKRVTVIAVAQNPEFSRYEKTISASFESILDDKSIQVLDLEKDVLGRHG